MYMHMHKGELLTVKISKGGLHIRCRHGKLWITQEGDSRDYLLGTGQELEMTCRGRVAITALEESQCFPEVTGGSLPPLQIFAVRG